MNVTDVEIKVDQGIVVIDMGLFVMRMNGSDAKTLGEAMFKRGCEANGHVPDLWNDTGDESSE